MSSGRFDYPIRAVWFNYSDGGFDLDDPPDHLCFLQAGENTANTPPRLSGRYNRGLVISCPYSSGTRYFGQMFISQTNSAEPFIYIRNSVSGVWGEWRQLQIDSDFTIDENIPAGTTVTFTDSRIKDNTYVDKGASYFGTPRNVGSKVTYTTNGTNHTVTLTGKFLGATTVHLHFSHKY